MERVLEKIYLDEIFPVTEQYKGKTIAVHLHAFYLDELPLYAKYLQNISVEYDLFLSVPENAECSEQDVKETFLAHSNLKKIVLARTPNKGRDIAPMICTFKDDLRKYDFLLHLHTKKSFHDDRLAGWAPFMLDHLLPDAQGVSKILTLLSKEYFLISPNELLKDLHISGWGERSCNLPIAQNIMDRSNHKVDLSTEYPSIEYPQGSFFWVRTESLSPLFDIGMTYDDFPEEPIPTDGTVAHALERLFCVWGWCLNKVYNQGLKAGKIVERNEDILKNLLLSDIRILEKKAEHRLKKMRLLLTISILLLIINVVLTILLLV